MPMSARAFAGLKAIAEWNPSMATFLMHLLKDMPHMVKYKDDPYGPLTLLLVQDVVDEPIFPNVNISVKLPPFPQEKLVDCEVFGDEWKQRKFTKQEFADALEQVLSGLL
jgi:hypothetical protein